MEQEIQCLMVAKVMSTSTEDGKLVVFSGYKAINYHERQIYGGEIHGISRKALSQGSSTED